MSGINNNPIFFPNMKYNYYCDLLQLRYRRWKWKRTMLLRVSSSDDISLLRWWRTMMWRRKNGESCCTADSVKRWCDVDRYSPLKAHLGPLTIVGSERGDIYWLSDDAMMGKYVDDRWPCWLIGGGQVSSMLMGISTMVGNGDGVIDEIAEVAWWQSSDIIPWSDDIDSICAWLRDDDEWWLGGEIFIIIVGGRRYRRKFGDQSARRI